MAAPKPPTQAKRTSPRIYLGLLACLLAGLGLRLYYSWKAYYLTFDSATIGLMAQHILAGERPVFFYGQGYMGSLEAYLAAVCVHFFGPNDLAVSLAPIIFSLLWVLFTYGLFSELADARTGLAAAATVALAGFYTMWYCVSNNGGYAPVFALGTFVLWRCVRVGRRQVSFGVLMGEVLFIGIAAALGLWCGLVILPYLLTGAIWLLCYLWRSASRIRTLAVFAGGGLLAAGGLLPSLLIRSDFPTSGTVTQFILSGNQIQKSLTTLAATNWPQLVFWDEKGLPAAGWVPILTQGAYYTLCLLLALATLVYLKRLFDALREGRLLAQLTPVLFVLCFLGLYLPHRMSLLNSPRYLIPAWGILLGGLWGLGPAGLAGRAGSWGRVMLGFYLALQLAGNLIYISQMAPHKTARVKFEQDCVRTTENTGVKHAMMVGNTVFGYEGQVLTFRAQDRVLFTSVWNERLQPMAQAAEGTQDYGLVVAQAHRDVLAATLDDLNLDYQLTPAGKLLLAHAITARPSRPISIPPRELKIGLSPDVPGQGTFLLDRRHDTSCEFKISEDQTRDLAVDLGHLRPITGIWLVAPDFYQIGLPRSYVLSGSRDGLNFEPIRETDNRIPTAYLAGPKAYLEGYYGMQEIRFAPTVLRYLKLEFSHGHKYGDDRIKLAEIFVFEHNPEPDLAPAPGVKGLLELIETHGIDFTIADRWLSAQLLLNLPYAKGDYPAFPRSNPQRFEYTRLSREVRPRKGLALAAARAVAGECEKLLVEVYGEAVIKQQFDLDGYRLLVLDDPQPDTAPLGGLVWTGHTLLRSERPADFWR